MLSCKSCGKGLCSLDVVHALVERFGLAYVHDYPTSGVFLHLNDGGYSVYCSYL